MNDALQQIQQELRACGFETYLVEGSPEAVIAFPYIPQRGRYAGQQFNVGLSFQEVDYPEYAPHWIHVSPAIEERHGPPGRQYKDKQGRKWVAFSRPPADFWDHLPSKNMENYVNLHLRRFWREA